MKTCKTSARRPVITPRPCGKNCFLQNKLPVPTVKSSPRRKNYFLQNKLPVPAVKSSPYKKTAFLQNKLPAASGNAKPVQKNYLFTKQAAGGIWQERLASRCDRLESIQI